METRDALPARRAALGFALAASLASGLAACSAEPSVPAKKEFPPLRPLSAKEPDRITVDHILVGVRGRDQRTAGFRRPEPEAKKVASEVLERLKKGEDWAALKREFSEDPPPGGPYGLANRGVSNGEGEFRRDGMVPAFGDLGFRLEVGGVGMADFDPVKSPFGYHIIKRVL